mmetsp:Transcript_693/g.880  ORF Transcript_693/g.880 Transcript_693/m.880 type:complete len:106 (-) Transcript_693:191-508(-)
MKFLYIFELLIVCTHGLTPSLQQRREILQVSCALFSAAIPPAVFAEESEEEARIRRKLAAQEKEGGSKRSYSEDLKAEREREKAIKSKSKKQQQEDLCELLGRGC